MRSAANGSMGTAWSSLSAETSCEPMPFSCTRTRKLSKPRITGRLAPGAKVEPMMPGLVCSTSARLAPGVLTMSCRGTTVRAAKTSSTMMPAGETGGGWASALGGPRGGSRPRHGARRRHHDTRQLRLRQRLVRGQSGQGNAIRPVPCALVKSRWSTTQTPLDAYPTQYYNVTIGSAFATGQALEWSKRVMALALVLDRGLDVTV